MMGSSELDGRVAGLVGRERERSAIDRLLERAALRESGSLVIRAEAGMGKTALLRYAGDQARGHSRALGHGRGSGVRPSTTRGCTASSARRRVLPRLPDPQRAALAAALGLAPAGGADRFLISAGVLTLLAAAAETSGSVPGR